MPIPRKYNIKVGDINPQHPQIEVIKEYTEESEVKGKLRKRRFLIVKCHVCAKDTELWGDGYFRQSIETFTKGSQPCGCSKHPRMTIDQWQVVLKRAARCNGLEYRGYCGEWNGEDTHITLYCEAHSHEYSTGSVAGLVLGRGCPKCRLDRQSKRCRKEDDYFISKWSRSGDYPEGTVFTRLSRTEWSVVCPNCKDETFFSNYSSLNYGRRPCKCASGRGYNKALSGYVYILKVDGLYNRFTGFGISNFFNNRLAEHTRNLNKEGLSVVESCDYFFEDGCIPREIESAIKSKFPLARQEIVGFKTEATHYDLFLDVRNFVEDYIENVAK